MPERAKDRIKSDVGDYVVEQVLKSVNQARSPVAGESWPKLSPGYKKKKQGEGLPGIANMELEGDMLDALESRPTKDGIEVGFFGDEAWKADGHLHFSAASDNAIAPQRRFLPDEGEEFIPSIQKGIESIISDALSDGIRFDTEDFSSVTTKADLYSVLQDYFDGMSRSEIKASISRTPKLVAFLDDEGLLKLL